MIDLGYMAKRVVERPDWLAAPAVRTVWSVSGCMSADFCDFTSYWRHNGFWLFDSPSPIREVAAEEGASLADTQLVFLRGYDLQFDQEQQLWSEFGPEQSIPTAVSAPQASTRMGYDIVTYQQQNVAECSPLSCNGLAGELEVNEYCLLDTLEIAIGCLEAGKFANTEPGYCRVIEVNSVEWLTE